MPTKKIVRKKRQIETVTFDVEGFDGQFEVPSIGHMKGKKLRELQEDGNTDVIEEFLRENGATDEADVFEDMTIDEMRSFQIAWQAASETNIPKS